MQNQNENAQEKKITIEAQFPIALGDLAAYIRIPKKESYVVIEMLRTNPLVPNLLMRKRAIRIFRVEKAEVKLKYLHYDYTDRESIEYGTAYFKVKLQGTVEALQLIAGKDNLFLFDWEAHDRSDHTADK